MSVTALVEGACVVVFGGLLVGRETVVAGLRRVERDAAPPNGGLSPPPVVAVFNAEI
jgi:hypothetical protein